MKTVAIIVVNDPDMINQNDFIPYQTSDCYFKVYYIDKTRKEYNTAAEGEAAAAMAVAKVCQAEQDGVTAAIIYAFGDLGVKEARKLASIPIMGLGNPSIHMASMICKNHFSVIVPLLSYNEFILSMINQEGLNNKFIPINQEIGMSAAQLKNSSQAFARLLEIAGFYIENHNIDTFIPGCGFFFGAAKPLQQELCRRYKRAITIIDPVALPLQIAAAI